MPETLISARRPQLKLELPVREMGIPVSPLPMDVRQRWQDWSTGDCDSPVRTRSVNLADVEEKLRLASERRKVTYEPFRTYLTPPPPFHFATSIKTILSFPGILLLLLLLSAFPLPIIYLVLAHTTVLGSPSPCGAARHSFPWKR